jgi:hypothetical protein
MPDGGGGAYHRMTRVRVWDEEAIQLIKDMWSAGAPASSIAEKTGRSRNAVLGKLFRLKVCGRDSVRPESKRLKEKSKEKPRAPPGRHRLNPRFQRSTPMPPKPRANREPRDYPNSVHLFDRVAGQCMFPIWADLPHPNVKDIMFCGDPTNTQEAIYCDRCRRVCYEPPEERKANVSRSNTAQTSIRRFNKGFRGRPGMGSEGGL